MVIMLTRMSAHLVPHPIMVRAGYLSPAGSYLVRIRNYENLHKADLRLGRGLGRIGDRVGDCVDWRSHPERHCVAAAQVAAGDCSPEPLNTGAEPSDVEDARKSATSVWKNWQMNAGELRDKVAKLGRAGLLAYGLFNGITYTTFFVVAFLGFEKSTGQNPAANLKACLGVVISMWTGNNFTRPLRVAGAAALAPFMDKVLKKTQKTLNLRNEASTFLLLVTSTFVLCFLIVGLLILSRLGR